MPDKAGSGGLGIERAATFATTMDEPGSAEHVIEAVHETWTCVRIMVPACDVKHAQLLLGEGVSGAVPETLEASLELCEQVLAGTGLLNDAARTIVDERRGKLVIGRDN